MPHVTIRHHRPRVMVRPMKIPLIVFGRLSTSEYFSSFCCGTNESKRSSIFEILLHVNFALNKYIGIYKTNLELLKYKSTGAENREYYKIKLPRKRVVHNKMMPIRKPIKIGFKNSRVRSFKFCILYPLIDNIGIYKTRLELLKDMKTGAENYEHHRLSERYPFNGEPFKEPGDMEILVRTAEGVFWFTDG
jgi:hypothetical protein